MVVWGATPIVTPSSRSTTSSRSSSPACGTLIAGLVAIPLLAGMRQRLPADGRSRRLLGISDGGRLRRVPGRLHGGAAAHLGPARGDDPRRAADLLHGRLRGPRRPPCPAPGLARTAAPSPSSAKSLLIGGRGASARRRDARRRPARPRRGALRVGRLRRGRPCSRRVASRASRRRSGACSLGDRRAWRRSPLGSSPAAASRTPGATSWGAVLFLAVITSIVGYVGWYWALDRGRHRPDRNPAVPAAALGVRPRRDRARRERHRADRGRGARWSWAGSSLRRGHEPMKPGERLRPLPRPASLSRGHPRLPFPHDAAARSRARRRARALRPCGRRRTPGLSQRDVVGYDADPAAGRWRGRRR